MDTIVSVTGLGYVGLPLAAALADHFPVVGFDNDKQRIFELTVKGHDRTNEVESAKLFNTRLQFTNERAKLDAANFHIVCVPTPIDEGNRPDLGALISATHSVGLALKKGDMVVYESTVYPGATEEDCVPILESVSGLKLNLDFKVGYSPERMNPGDKKHGLADVVKVIAASDDEGLNRMAFVYGKVCTAGVYVARSIRVAEAAKILENTQRDVNVALMNEFAIICDRMGVNTMEAIDAAATKWNFARYVPGLVGGHCIGVDPYYLIDKSERLGYTPQMLKACRRINDGMGKFIALKAVKALAKRGGLPVRPTATILGFTFKENCPDVRNTRVTDIIAELSSFGFTVQVNDPLADKSLVSEEYGVELKDFKELLPADVVIIATAHECYKHLPSKTYQDLLESGGFVLDVKNVLIAQHIKGGIVRL